MFKIYLCEGDAEKGVQKATGFNDLELALDASVSSNEKVHFLSTINPLESEVQNGQSPDAHKSKEEI